MSILFPLIQSTSRLLTLVLMVQARLYVGAGCMNDSVRISPGGRSMNPWLRIPVAVIKGRSIEAGENVSKTERLKPGQIIRDFYIIPENCSYVKITVDGEIEGQHVIHWRQVMDGSSTNQFSKRRYPKTQGQGCLVGQTLKLTDKSGLHCVLFVDSWHPWIRQVSK